MVIFSQAEVVLKLNLIGFAPNFELAEQFNIIVFAKEVIVAAIAAAEPAHS